MNQHVELKLGQVMISYSILTTNVILQDNFHSMRRTTTRRKRIVGDAKDIIDALKWRKEHGMISSNRNTIGRVSGPDPMFSFLITFMMILFNGLSARGIICVIGISVGELQGRDRRVQFFAGGRRA